MRRFFPVVAMLSLAAPAARAYEPNPLHVCLVGCDAPKEAGFAAGELKLNPVLYMGPSMAMTVAERDSLTREWTLGASLSAGYGLRWHPKAWPLESPALALDVFARFGFAGDVARLDVVPMLTVANLLSVGVGVRCELAAERDRCGYLLAFGAGVSL